MERQSLQRQQEQEQNNNVSNITTDIFSTNGNEKSVSKDDIKNKERHDQECNDDDDNDNDSNDDDDDDDDDDDSDSDDSDGNHHPLADEDENGKKKILPMDTKSIQRIVSGQAINDLSSTVKELVDNSLDANSKVINIRLWNSGIDIIEVSDDGDGIPLESRSYVAMKHTTSKIRNFDDIYSTTTNNNKGNEHESNNDMTNNTNSINNDNKRTRTTLGFRGEALFCIANISQKLIIATRTCNEDTGQKIDYDNNGYIIHSSIKQQHRKVGTTVAIVGLFAKLPVRKVDYIKRIKKQRLDLIKLLQGYAILCPGVQIKLIDMNMADGSESDIKLCSPSNTKSIHETISSILGYKFYNGLNKLNIDLTSIVIDESSKKSTDTNGECESEPDNNSNGITTEGTTTDNDNNNTTPLWKIEGLVSKSPLQVNNKITTGNKKSHGTAAIARELQFFSINGRPVELPKISRIIGDTWKAIYPDESKRPACIICLSLPNNVYDVNLSPNKREVLLVHETSICNAIYEKLVGLWTNQNQSLSGNNNSSNNGNFHVITNQSQITSKSNKRKQIQLSSLEDNKRSSPSIFETQTQEQQQQRYINNQPRGQRQRFQRRTSMDILEDAYMEKDDDGDDDSNGDGYNDDDTDNQSQQQEDFTTRRRAKARRRGAFVHDLKKAYMQHDDTNKTMQSENILLRSSQEEQREQTAANTIDGASTTMSSTTPSKNNSRETNRTMATQEDDNGGNDDDDDDDEEIAESDGGIKNGGNTATVQTMTTTTPTYTRQRFDRRQGIENTSSSSRNAHSRSRCDDDSDHDSIDRPTDRERINFTQTQLRFNQTSSSQNDDDIQKILTKKKNQQQYNRGQHLSTRNADSKEEDNQEQTMINKTAAAGGEEPVPVTPQDISPSQQQQQHTAKIIKKTTLSEQRVEVESSTKTPTTGSSNPNDNTNAISLDQFAFNPTAGTKASNSRKREADAVEESSSRLSKRDRRNAAPVTDDNESEIEVRRLSKEGGDSNILTAQGSSRRSRSRTSSDAATNSGTGTSSKAGKRSRRTSNNGRDDDNAIPAKVLNPIFSKRAVDVSFSTSSEEKKDSHCTKSPALWHHFRNTDHVIQSYRESRTSMHSQRETLQTLLSSRKTKGTNSPTAGEERQVPSVTDAADSEDMSNSNIADKDNIVSLSNDDFQQMKIIGQFNLGFILAQCKNGHLWILDQHGCDERYNFEGLCNKTDIREQPLIAPMPLELSPTEECCILDNLDVFKENGFRFKYDAEKEPRHRLSLTSLPHSGAQDGRKAVQYGKEDVLALCSLLLGADGVSSYGDEAIGSGFGTGVDGSGKYGNNAVRRHANFSSQMTISNKVKNENEKHAAGDDIRKKERKLITFLPKSIAMFASRACRTSIMIGAALSEKEMNVIVKKLSSVNHPWSCPHGRPTMRYVKDLLEIMIDDERKAGERYAKPTMSAMTQLEE